MSSSESENENLLHSVIDHDFVNKILMQAASSESPSAKSLPSLRTKEKNNDNYELKVSPGFKKHVAKHLDSIIQRNIKEVCKARSKPKVASKETPGGIKLFSHSKSLLTERDLVQGSPEQMSPSKRIRKRKSKHFSDGSSDEASNGEWHRIASAAVSPEWVLQRKGAYGKCEKGKVVRLKDSGNGHLIEISTGD